MARLLHSGSSGFWSRWSQVILAAHWLAGCTLGITLFFRCDAHLLTLMPMAVRCRVSIVGLLTVNLLPFLFSAFAVYLSFPQGLGLIAFCKGLCFSFVSCGALHSFGSAGWLVRSGLMFGDITATTLLYWYWARHISGRRDFSLLEIACFCGTVCFLTGVDYRYIAPFMWELF